MAKKAYVGVGGSSRNVKAIYVGVGGVPRKVIKGYVGVNGVPCLFWGSSKKTWLLWTSVSGQIADLGTTNKTNNKIAYYAAIKTVNGDKALLMSPDADAVVTSYGSHTAQGSISDVRHIPWYYNARTDISQYSSECLLSDTIYSDVSQAAQDLLDMIFATPFCEDYQVGETYPVELTDVEKTIRRQFGMFLVYLISRTDTCYITFSDNIETIIATALGKIAGGSTVCIQMDYSGTNYIEARIDILTDSISQFSVYSSTVSYGMKFYTVYINSNTWRERVRVLANGTINWSTGQTGYLAYCAVGLSGNGISSSNIGTDL